jgi:PPOX class probable F420-dependent enzyme
MAAELPESVRKRLQEASFWQLATVNPDGSPQSSTVWADLRGDKILVNSALGRKKPRNIEREPRIAMSWHGTSDGGGYETIGIQGRVVETTVGDQAEADIDSLAQKYIGQSPYPWRSPGERRVSYAIEPTHVHHYAA